MSTATLTQASLAINDHAADMLFREAHTTYRFTDEPVTDEQMEAVYDLIKTGPTAMNGQPMRVTLVRSDAGRAALINRLGPGNVEKTESAPLVAILSYDINFHEHLPEMFPQFPGAKDMFANEADRIDYGRLNAAIQAGYFLVGVRAAGLAAGPMGGFDAAGVDEDFFPDGTQKSFLVVNIGHPADGGQFPRNPRLDYRTAVTTV